MSFMVRVCSRETLAEATVVIGGQNVKFDRAMLRNSIDGTISIIFQLSQESIKALSSDGVKMTSFSVAQAPAPVDTKLHETATERDPLVQKPAGPKPAEVAVRAPVHNPLNERHKSTWLSMCEALAAWKF